MNTPDFSLFFFSSRRRHTRCSRDWSSDVCSSDLIPPPHDRADQPGPDFPNFGELRTRGMRPRILDEPGEVWVRDKYAERVEDDGCSVLSGTLPVDQLAELIKLEVGGNDTADVSMQRCAQS